MKAQSQGSICGLVGCELTKEGCLEGNSLDSKPRANFAAWLQGCTKLVLKRMDHSEVSEKGSDTTWVLEESVCLH